MFLRERVQGLEHSQPEGCAKPRVSAPCLPVFPVHPRANLDPHVKKQ